MRASETIRRIFWPVITMVATTAAYLAFPWIVGFLNLEEGAEPLRLIIGSASYFASAWLGGRLIGIALDRASARRHRVPRLLKELIAVGLFGAAVIATIILVLGHSMSGALAGSGIIVAILGFALRNVIGDIFSGIALGIEAPYRIGDWVEVENTVKGRIVEIGWRTTRLLTRDQTYMILPNSQIARQRLTNYSAPRRHYRAQVQINLDHAVPVAEAKTLLAEAAAKAPLILDDPRPDARTIAYDAGSIQYTVRYWVPSFADDIDCRDAVLTAIDAAIRERGLPPPRTRFHFDMGPKSAATMRAIHTEAAD